jgi:hypothetical protein
LVEEGTDASVMPELAVASDAAQIDNHPFADDGRLEDEGFQQQMLHRGGGGLGPGGRRGGRAQRDRERSRPLAVVGGWRRR